MDDVQKVPDGDTSPLSAEDALFGFVASLTTRDKPITMSRAHDGAPAMEALKAFMDANGLSDVSDNFPDTFVMPV